VRLAGAWVDLCSCRLWGPKSVHLGNGAAANCAAPRSIIAGQYATLNCKLLLSGFPCKWQYINVETFNLQPLSAIIKMTADKGHVSAMYLSAKDT